MSSYYRSMHFFTRPSVKAFRLLTCTGFFCPGIAACNKQQQNLSFSTFQKESEGGSRRFFPSGPSTKSTTWASVCHKAEGAAISAYFNYLRFSAGNWNKMHSEKCVIDLPNLKIIGIPALSDNFMYLVIEKSSMQAVVVDPVEPDTVMSEVRNENVTLTAILTTHHHWDHAGGNKEMVKKYKAEVANSTLPVYGGDERVDALTNKIGQGDVISLGALTFHCHFTPCHTKGHICYFLESQDPNVQKPAVFTGDTLFIAGCGRFFEGTPEQMHSALVEKLGKLPPETMVFCGHEYTVNNLKFALSVEPNNIVVQNKLVWAEEQRKNRLPTIPSSIGGEKDINPFMRCVLPEVQAAVETKSPIECMGKLRNMKDSFKA